MKRNNYVAKFLLTGFLFATGFVATAQDATIEDLNVTPMRMPALAEVGGSPFMTNEYQTASITLGENKSVLNVPVKFNIYSNAIMVQKNGEDLRLESFVYVSYNQNVDGRVKPVMFGQGYPEIDNHNDKSVYQILSKGSKVHLLKYISQKVEDAPTLGDYSRRELVTVQQLYIYTPGGEIKRIKASKQSLVEALPALSSKIDEVVSANKINLKSESGIAELVEALNRP
ncbi:MAG TPA: hypothetical protein VGO58_02565 [Chitinophagaceae bacterium]|jgi:hypothetical protein|nr:hypothetical protein [Chitinophagaceae bacterium]